MYNLLFILSSVILAVLIGKMIHIDIRNSPLPLARTGDYIEKGNFTYFYIHYNGLIILNLTSLSGDADLYVSDVNMYPTYDPDLYALQSTTCGEDIIEIPDSFMSPLAVAVYGYAEHTDFLLEIYEAQNYSYSHKKWVSIEKEIEHPKEDIQRNPRVDLKNNSSYRNTNIQKQKKKKTRSNYSNMPSIFSVLEILQLIFL